MSSNTHRATDAIDPGVLDLFALRYVARFITARLLGFPFEHRPFDLSQLLRGSCSILARWSGAILVFSDGGPWSTTA